MKAIIHIGTPKSGSTTIQSLLALNSATLPAQGFRHELFDKDNVAQMELGLAGMIRAGDILTEPNKLHAMKVGDRKSQEAYVDRLEATLREGVQRWPEHTYIASSEQVFAWLSRPARVAALDGFLRNIFSDVRYIVYYRPQTELMVSSYSERLKRGERLTFDEHFAERLEKMNWYRRSLMWRDAVGMDRFSIRVLDPQRMVNGDLIDDFCEAAGLDRAGLLTPPRMNQSLTTEEMALILKVGRYFKVKRRSGAPNPAFRAVFWWLRKRLPRPGTRLSLTPEQFEAVRQVYARSNERLRAEFLPHLPTLFSRQ